MGNSSPARDGAKSGSPAIILPCLMICRDAWSGLAKIRRTSAYPSARAQETPVAFDHQREYLHQDELYGLEGRPVNADSGSLRPQKHYGAQWGLLKFSQPVTAPQVSLPHTLHVTRLFPSELIEDSSPRPAHLTLL